jgi:hypothetical protein
MIEMRNTNTLASGLAIALSTIAFAQTADGVPVAVTPVNTTASASAWNLNWSFDETAEMHTFKSGGSTLLGLNQNLGVDITKDISMNLNVPVYTQDDNTTIGDISLGGSWTFMEGKNDTIGTWDLAFGGGIYIPVGSEYFRSANVNPFINGKFDCKAWVFDFTQTAEYRFDGGEAYITWLGAMTNSDVLTLESNLSYEWNAFDFGVQFDQVYYVNSGESQLFLGPVANWTVASSVDLNMGVLIPVSQNVDTPEANAIVTAGIGIKF